MHTDEQLKEIVREKYSQIANSSTDKNAASCCGSCGCDTGVYNMMEEGYNDLKGYNPEADLGLGCGLPTEFAKIKKGDTVVDLGSGAGNDAFVARAETGESGRVIGIDFTPAMIEKARSNAEKLQFHNVEFRLGDLENMPLASNVADVVLSNCVLNLVPNKEKVFKEIYRVLKPHGHFSISDIVLVGELPDDLKQDAEMYAGCVSGAIQKEKYLQIISNRGFDGISIQKEREINIPEEILRRYLNDDEMESFRNGSAGIYSITVSAEKGARTCCAPDAGCC